MMRLVLLLPLLTALPAQADLYRWIEPHTGSVKLSSVPPPWYGDPEREARSPKVELIRYAPAPKPAPAVALPAVPAAVPAAAVVQPKPPAADSGVIGALEARLRALQAILAAVPSQQDFNRGGEPLQRHLKAYEALVAELDRMDPGGAARRKAQETGLADQIRKGLEAQLGTKSAVSK